MKQGSIALLLESSPEVLQRIESLYRKGELRDLLGVPALAKAAEAERHRREPKVQCFGVR